MDKNPSWFLYGPGEAKLECLPVPEIKNPHDVIVRIACVGVCGSDVHFWKHGGVGKKVTRDRPLVLGHEASGVVHAVGSAVSSLSVGDHVAVEPGRPCRRCNACKTGSYNLCRDMKFAAVPPDVHGTLTKYFMAPDDFVYPVPQGISLQEAVLSEPLSVAVHAVRLAEISPGQNAIVMGSGTIGLLCGAVAKEFGAQRIVIVDIAQQKLSFAADFLGCETYLSLDESPEESSDRMQSMLGIADGVDAVIEASGAQNPVQAGIYVLRRGGRYVQAGVGKPKSEIPILALSQKELQVRGCFRYGPGDYELALKMLPRLDLKRLITSVTPFESATQAWDRTGRGEGIKNLIEGVKD